MWADQRTVVATLANIGAALAAENPPSRALIVVGEVVAKRGQLPQLMARKLGRLT